MVDMMLTTVSNPCLWNDDVMYGLSEVWTETKSMSTKETRYRLHENKYLIPSSAQYDWNSRLIERKTYRMNMSHIVFLDHNDVMALTR